jgi:hypothetical protein
MNIPKRPNRNDAAVKAAAAEALAVKVNEYLHQREWDQKEIAEQLLPYITEDDGCKFAIHLKGDGWDPDMGLAEVLDGDHLGDAHRQAVTQWAIGYQIYPRYAVGDLASYRDVFSKTYVHGKIVAIDKFRAQYLVASAPDHVPAGEVGTQGVLVDFEDIDGEILGHGPTVTGPLFCEVTK